MIEYADFEKVALHSGTITKVELFPEARKPAYKIWVDFGPVIGIKKTSAQITQHYAPESLIGKQVMGVTNFPPKNIAGFASEFLLCGFSDEKGAIILAVPEQRVSNGEKLH